jgi:hypothetical protein
VENATDARGNDMWLVRLLISMRIQSAGFPNTPARRMIEPVDHILVRDDRDCR